MKLHCFLLQWAGSPPCCCRCRTHTHTHNRLTGCRGSAGKGGAPAPVPVHPTQTTPAAPIPRGRNINLVGLPCLGRTSLLFLPPASNSQKHSLTQLASRSLTLATTNSRSRPTPQTDDDKDHHTSLSHSTQIAKTFVDKRHITRSSTNNPHITIPLSRCRSQTSS